MPLIVYHDPAVDRKISCPVLTEQQVLGRDLQELIRYELRRHVWGEKIPVIHTWTPRYDLVAAGFRKEAEIDLLSVKMQDRQMKSSDIKFDVGKAEIRLSGVFGEIAKLSGSQELLELNRERLESVFADLNERGIEYLVVRSYRGFPAWDNVQLYSQGTFPDNKI